MKRIGQGANGEVFDDNDGHAIKKIKLVESFSGTDSESFICNSANLREIVFAFLSQNQPPPHGLIMYDRIHIDDNGTASISMIKGKCTLHSHIILHSSASRLNCVKDMFSKILRAVDSLHTWGGTGVSHGDLKPENIVLLDDSQIKIIDLGSCRMLTSNKDRMQMGCTYEYAAPEIFDRTKVYGLYDKTASDSYSVGAIMIYYLFREYLVDSRKHKNVSSIVQYFKNDGVFFSLSCIRAVQKKVWSKVPADVMDTIIQMLHPNPTKRCTIKEAIKRLEIKPGTSNKPESGICCSSNFMEFIGDQNNSRLKLLTRKQYDFLKTCVNKVC